jgi:hypothetical protein
VYVPLREAPPSERPFGFVFRPGRDAGRLVVVLLAFGEAIRHQARGVSTSGRISAFTAGIRTSSRRARIAGRGIIALVGVAVRSRISTADGAAWDGARRSPALEGQPARLRRAVSRVSADTAGNRSDATNGAAETVYLRGPSACGCLQSHLTNRGVTGSRPRDPIYSAAASDQYL